MVSIRQWAGSGRALGAGEMQGEPTVEAALVRAGKAGDLAALERLLGLHKRALFSLCYGILGHADDAEDAVQETFLRALGALSTFREDSAFGTWLFRIALNLCLRCKATAARDPDLRPALPWDEERRPVAAGASSPEAIALRQLRMREALGTLLPRHRAILLLKEREGWSIAEIAAAMGWKEKRVENELARARHALVEWRRREAGEGETG